MELADGIDRAGAWLGFPGELNFEAEDLAVVEGCGPDILGAVLGRIGPDVTVIDPPRLRDLVDCLPEIEDGRFGLRRTAAGEGAGGARLGESEFAGAPGGLVRCSEWRRKSTSRLGGKVSRWKAMKGKKSRR